MSDLHSQRLQAFYSDEAPIRSHRPNLEPGAAQAVHDGVGRQLRNYYADLVEQPLPERFIDVLNRLERASAGESQ